MNDDIPNEIEAVDFDTLNVADTVRCWCGKCKGFFDHNIQALRPGKRPISVCKHCQSVHQVRFHRPGTKRKAKSKVEKAPPVNTWFDVMKGHTVEESIEYSIKGDFNQGEVVNHTVFGLGKVMKRIENTKVEIIFESGTKTMIHKR